MELHRQCRLIGDTPESCRCSKVEGVDDLGQLGPPEQRLVPVEKMGELCDGRAADNHATRGERSLISAGPATCIDDALEDRGQFWTGFAEVAELVHDDQGAVRQIHQTGQRLVPVPVCHSSYAESLSDGATDVGEGERRILANCLVVEAPALLGRRRQEHRLSRSSWTPYDREATGG